MAAAQITFGTYVSRWYAALDLAASTMQNYRRHIEEHLLPAFENRRRRHPETQNRSLGEA